MGQNGRCWPHSSKLRKGLDAERWRRRCEADMVEGRTVLPCDQRESSHPSIWADINITSSFFFLFQQRIRESLTGAADGRGSHRLQKYPEVYTSQTRSQIGIRTEALLWRGKGSILKYILLTFLLIFLPPEVWILGEWQQRWVQLQKIHQVLVRLNTVRFGGHSGVTGREQGTLVLALKHMLCFLLQRFENTGDVPLLRISQSPDISSTLSYFCFFFKVRQILW